MDVTLGTDYFYKLHSTVFVMDTEFVVCEEETEFLNIMYLKLRFQSLNHFQPSDAMWRHTFRLSLICMSFAQ
jgi:hypothetical protein